MTRERITRADGTVYYRPLPPFIGVRVTLEDGDYWDTQMRGTIDECRRYFMQGGGYTDRGNPDGPEKLRRIVSVETIGQ